MLVYVAPLKGKEKPIGTARLPLLILVPEARTVAPALCANVGFCSLEKTYELTCPNTTFHAPKKAHRTKRNLVKVFITTPKYRNKKEL
jgi:hypothetical protein